MSRSEYASDTFLAAAGTSVHLLRRAPGGEHRYDGVAVPHAAAVAAARFNRNNKVVAAGCADGRIQLAYSAGGGVMSVLPEGGAGPGGQPLGPITALAWSAGSKRLVAGSADGSLTLFDMQRQISPACLGRHSGGVAALDFQHDDSFLAVAGGGGSLDLYPNPLRPGSAAAPLPPPPDAGPPLCLALAASEPLVAAGGARGGVAVWDVPSLALSDHHPGLHGGHAAAAVAFVPTRPACLYSGGGDGRVCLLDRRRGPGHASSLTLGCPVTALTVREDHAVLGVGTADGCVRLFDPRNPRQPLCSTRLPEDGPITALQWQHRYHSLAAGRPRAAGDAAAAPAGRGGQADQGLAAGQGASAPPPPLPSAASPVKRAPGVSAAAATAAAGPAGTPASAASRALPSRQAGLAAPAAPPPPPPGAGTPGGALAPAASSGLRAPPASWLPEPAAPAPPLDISPLPGAAPCAAAAPAQAAPAQRAQQERDPSELERRLHRLGISPLPAGPGAAAGPPQPTPPSPLEQPAAGAAPPSLAITPLAAPGLARLAAAGGLAGSRREAPPSLDVAPPPPLQAGPPAAPLPLAISPLPTGTRLWGSAVGTPASPKQPSQQQQQRSVLGERTNSGGGMLSPLPPPLPTAAAREAKEGRQQLASPPFVASAPLLDAQPASRPAVDFAAGGDGGGSAPPKAAPQVQPLSPMGSGGGGAWHIGAVAGEAAGGATPPLASSAALVPSPARGKTLVAAPAPDSWSFAAAERSFLQLSSGPGAAWAAGGDVLAAQAGAGAVPPGGLRDDILALHLDMLTQFQVQQAATGALVGRLMERNEELGGEVAALRRQLDALTSRRDAFLLL